MILDDGSLRSALDTGELRVEPLWEHAIQPNSIDLHLGTSICRPRVQPFVVADSTPKRLHEVDRRFMELQQLALGELFLLQPGEFILATTHEWVLFGPGLMGWVTGCSSVARAGLAVEMAGLVDAGFGGNLTLELVNLAPYPLMLGVGERIAQLVVARLLRPAQRPYGTPGLGSRYQGQIVATAALPPQPQWAERAGGQREDA